MYFSFLKHEVADYREKSSKHWVYEDMFPTDCPGEPFQSWKENVKWTDSQIPVDGCESNICLSNLCSLKQCFVFRGISHVFRMWSSHKKELSAYATFWQVYFLSWVWIKVSLPLITVAKIYWPSRFSVMQFSYRKSLITRVKSMVCIQSHNSLVWRICWACFLILSVRASVTVWKPYLLMGTTTAALNWPLLNHTDVNT